MFGSILYLLNLVLTLLVLVAAPLVGYPLARVLTHGRRAIDSMLNWNGAHAELAERIEDGITHAMALLAGLAALILCGAVYVWYVQTIALGYHPWVYRLIGNLPYVGTQSLGHYNVGPAVYWSVLFFCAGLVGWLRETALGETRK